RALTGTLAPVASDGVPPAAGAPRELVWHTPLGRPDVDTAAWHLDVAIRPDRRYPVDAARVWALGPDRSWIAPTVLTEAAVPRATFVSTFDGQSALLTGHADGRSLRVDAAGHVTPLPSWPVPVLADIPWGGDGGRLAWSIGDRPSLLFRPSADAADIDIVRVDVPFRPVRAAAGPDGRPVWTSLDGGLWTWLPGERAARRVVDVGPAVGIVWQDGAFRIDPLPVLPDGSTPRIVADFAWRWMPGDPAVTRFPLGAEAQSYATAVSRGFTLRAHALADTVRLTTPDGRAFNLMVYCPVAAGWAGPSLVVVTGPCDVLLFRDLQHQLDAGRSDAGRAREQG
ncbi:MAG: hypothetical protein KGN76_10710, partial [Acidobacteriota bacterium]|nr:hypothetical protein [Acidobacteriota bacterium]